MKHSRAWFPWTLYGIALVGVLISIIFLWNAPTPQADVFEFINRLTTALFPVVFGGVSALILSRQVHNRIGWLLMVITLTIAVGGTVEYYLEQTISQASQLTVWQIFFIWLIGWSWWLLIGPLLLILLIFPTGQLLSPRWRWVVGLLGGLFVFFVVFASLLPEWTTSNQALTVPNPLPLTLLPPDFTFEVIQGPWIIGLVSAAALCVWSVIVRYRRSSGIEREQMKWFVFAGLIFMTVFASSGLLFRGEEPPTWMGTIFNAALTFLPVSIGIAILRYRLWDIDFVINRSLVYGGLTAALVAVFASVLWGVSLVAQGQALLIAFGLTAALGGAFFQPARRRLQRFVDQRFYHIEIDYQKTPPAHAAPLATPAQHTFGPYGGLELIGRGGMGEVYKAQHPTLNRTVALKLLPAALAAEGDFRQRFQREVKTLTALRHPHIVQVFESGEVNGAAYMVMEYLAGQDLAAHLRTQGRLPLPTALPILTAIAHALDYAHAQGFVHRDIKPSNVMLETKPEAALRPVLTDFGIAKILGGQTRMTHTGGMLGTFDYIAPEQIQGAADVDGRADVYALGVMAYQMLTGDLPFRHSNPGALLIAHLTQPAPDPREAHPDLPPAVTHALQTALAKTPAERFATAGALVAALAEA